MATLSYGYDAAGRRSSLTVPGQAVANYTFDNANRLTQVAQGSTTISFSYDNANRRTTLTLPNGIVVSYGYDNASELTALSYVKGSTTLGNLTYSYDLNGRRTNIGGSFAATNLPNAVSTTAYNANNQLASWGTANLFYDLNGNMTSDGTHSYTWDARNHLKQIDSGTTASFVYDPFGRRASKSILGAQTGFLYDGANPVQELSGTTVTANSLMGGIDEVFQRTDSAGSRSFLTDALGGSIALADSTGTLQTEYIFDPFGNTTVSGSGTANSFAYTGRELDAAGLYFNRARYYDPQLQRFISEDPIGFTDGNVNLYAYVGNDPANFTDPYGLSPLAGTGCSDKDKKKKCKGKARVLKGNPNLMGKPGGWSGPSVGDINVAAGTAAVVPGQWGGKGNLRPNIGAISGTSNGQPLFNGISDIVGGKSPIPGMSAGEALISLNPGDLIIELPTGNDLGVVPIELTIPAKMPCPAGTTEVPQ